MISSAALGLVIEQEVSDRATYVKKYQHFDWPQGDSGPTVGIGYDCGYCSRSEIKADWAGIIPDAMIAALVEASGIKGARAAAWVRANRNRVTITWDQAYRQLIEREIPKWEKRLSAAIPNTETLHPDARGALLSLVYNRGEDMDPEKDRRREMRAIRDHMAIGRLDLVDDDIRAMVRLWPDTPGLRKRRLIEADLFERGVAAMREIARRSAVVSDPESGAAPVLVPPAVSEAELAAQARMYHEPPDPPPPRPTTGEVARSPSTWAALMAAVATVLNAIGDWVAKLFGGLPDVVAGTQAMLDPLQSLAGIVGGFVQSQKVLATAAVVCLAFVILRRFQARGAPVLGGAAQQPSEGGSQP